MQTKYKARAITEEERNELLALKPSDITLSLLRSYLAGTTTGNARFNPNDTLTIPAKHLYNDRATPTTVGRLLANLVLLDDPAMGENVGYINYPLNGKGMGKLEGQMSALLLDDVITPAVFGNFIDKTQWLGFSTTDFLTPPLSSDILMAPPKVKARKAELLADPKRQEALANGEIQAATEIEDELLDMAAKELADLPDMDIYNSGSRGSWGNNYKMTAISRGPVKDFSDPNRVDISMASLDDGIPPEERYIYADILTNASSSRSLQTQDGGLTSLQFTIYKNKLL